MLAPTAPTSWSGRTRGRSWRDATAATLDANTHPGWQETVAPHAFAIARAINASQQ